MTTGLTPLYNAYRAAGKVLFDVPYAAGQYANLITGESATPSSFATLIRNGFVNTSALTTEYAAYATFAIPERALTFIADITRNSSAAVASQIMFDGKLVFRTMTAGRVSLQNDGLASAVSANNSFLQGERKVFVATRSGADPSLCNLYLNGALSGAANQSGGTITAGTQNVKTNRAGQGNILHRLIVIDEEMSATNAALITTEIQEARYETQDCFWPVSTTVYWRGAFGALARETAMADGRSIGDINELVVASGTHKMSTEKLDGILTKCLVCVTNGTINLPAYNLGANYVFEKYTASTGLWTTVTQASRSVALLAGDKILWANQTGNRHIKRIY